MGHFLGRLSAVFLRGRRLCLLTALLCGVTTVAGDDTRATAVSIAVNSSAGGSISPAGDMDYWRINAPSAGQLVVETTGSTDTIGVLEDSAGNQLEQHDDQDVNTNRNFKSNGQSAPEPTISRSAPIEMLPVIIPFACAMCLLGTVRTRTSPGTRLRKIALLTLPWAILTAMAGTTYCCATRTGAGGTTP